MKKKNSFLSQIILLFVLFLGTQNAYSQNGTIKGIIKTADGKPIESASIKIKGQDAGVVSDKQGVFSIKVPAGQAIAVSAVGYQVVELVPIPGQENAITLNQVVTELDQVVVVGYGTQKKVNLSGSVVSIKGDDLTKRNTIQTTQALQGMAPGVTVTSNSGKPGKENSSIRIRGIGTVNDNNPLVLIDGVASSVDAVDPNDIETMSILKDAASSSIYGSRAANGVILITTKRGKTDKVNLTYRSSVGFTTPLVLPQNATAWDYMTLYDEANGNDLRTDAGVPGGSIYGAATIDKWKNATDRDAFPNTDMMREAYRDKAFQTQHYIGFSVGSEKFKSNTSLNYSWQDALLPNTEYKRYGLRSNNSYTVNKVLEFGFDLSMRNTKIKDAAPNTEIEGMMRHPAIYQTLYSNGIWGTSYAGGTHPMQQIYDNLVPRTEDYQEILAKISAKITPFKGMQIDFWYTPKYNWSNFKNLFKRADVYDYKTGLVAVKNTGLATISEQRDFTREDDLNLLLNYTKTMGQHTLSALGGFQYLTNDFNTISAFRQGNNFQQFEQISSFDPTGMTNGGNASQWALMSYFGRLNYNYAGKYFLEANVRNDGSSRFANGYKWGLFPSFSGAWRFSAENFMKNIDWLSNGKLRASWGELGNQSGLGSNYPFALNVATNQFTVFNGILNPGYAPVNYALSNITWESSKMIDFGIDLSLFKGKVDVTFDWYKKQTNNILLNLAIPGVMGYANSPRQNAGSMENIGWDAAITYRNNIGDVAFKVTGILSDVQNQITNFGGLAPQVSGNKVRQVGSPIDAFYGLVSDGFFSSFAEARAYSVAQFGKLQGGDLRYIDQDGDKKLTGTDRVVLGSPIPRYTHSLEISASYKGFDLALFFQGVGKRDSYVSGWTAYPFQNASTALIQHLDRWSEANPNPNAAYPRLSINQQSNNLQASNFWMVNAAYVRLKNIQLGYTLPTRWLKGTGLTGASFFANGNNLITISKMPIGMDPESPESTQNTVPLLATYTFGVNLKF
jgi:TonB-linked SusC/RagA family outer membrane protein